MDWIRFGTVSTSTGRSGRSESTLQQHNSSRRKVCDEPVHFIGLPRLLNTSQHS